MKLIRNVLVLVAVVVIGWQLIPIDKALLEGEQVSTYVDLHVHTAGIGAGDSGCFINEAMRDSYKFPIYLAALGVSFEEIEQYGDRLVLERLSAQVAASRRVGNAVVLAMDGVIDTDGTLDRERTQLYVPNDYLARELQAFDNLLFGASINPYRTDALARLDQVHRDGAVLVKWIPNIMLIDPADPAITPFYRRMAELGLPLLSHAGSERSFAHAEDRFGDPARLALPLGLGVTVIAAHLGSGGATDGQPNFERLLPMFERFDNLYADISALTQINRLGALRTGLGASGVVDRMVYGSDWPLQFFPLVSPVYHLPDISPRTARSIAAMPNQWDRDVALKEAIGVDASVFERSARLLGLADR